MLLVIAALAAACTSHRTGLPVRQPIAQEVASYGFPALTDRVVDAAHLLPSVDRQRVIAASARLEHDTGHQLFVVTVPSLRAHSVENYGFALANYWGIGRRGYNDGVLLLVAAREHAIRIEVGCGLEAALRDEEAKMIIDHDMTPAFRRGDFGTGIREAVVDIVRDVTPERGAT